MNTKQVSSYLQKLLGVSMISLLFAATAQAEPALQVDIDGGEYDATADIQDVYTTDTEFTLRALCDTSYGAECTEGTFALSIALTPGIAETNPGPDLGSITVTYNGTTLTINVTADMVYGTPPLDADQSFDAGDLSKHGSFPTYFYELAVSFNSDDMCGAAQYNVQNDAGNCTESGTGSYYDLFKIDASNLADGYGLHFDLYDPILVNGDTDLPNSQIAFAPFSKDATYRCCTKVPEPGTIGLLGIGLLGLGFARRRKSVV